jgi:hypothetical protein
MTTLRMWQKELVLSSKDAAGGTPVTQEKLTVDRISAIHEECWRELKLQRAIKPHL